MRTGFATTFLYVVFGPFGALCVVWTFQFARRGQLPSALVALGFAFFALGMISVATIVASKNVTPQILRDDLGTVLRPDPKIDRFGSASLIGAFVGMTAYAVFTPLGLIEIPVPRGDQRYFVIACAIGALVGTRCLWHLHKQNGTSYLRITRDGFQLGSTVALVEHSWGEVTAIANKAGMRRSFDGTTHIHIENGRTRTVPSNWYTPGGRALDEALRYYWQHPEGRDELLDGRIAERLNVDAQDAA